MAWLGQVSHLLGMGSLIILPCSCSVMNMILWHDCYSFSVDGTEVGWHPSSVPLILVLFLSLIISGTVRHLGVLLAWWYLLSMDVVKMRWYQFFCVVLLFLLFTCHHIVVFCYMPSSSRWYITTLLFSISVFLIFSFFATRLLWMWYLPPVAL